MARLAAEAPDEPEEEEESAPRFRLRGARPGAGGGAASGKRGGARAARSKGASSDNEDVADDEVTAAWLADLEQRSPSDLRDAFTLKPCSTKDLRQLGDSCYLGGKRCAGALPIFDLQGKVSLQFLLASYKVSEKSRDRLRGEDAAVDLHRPFLRWLMKKARELKLLSAREMSRRALAPGRVEAAMKSGQWLMSLEQNQAEASDEEGRQKKAQQRQRAAEEASMRFDVQFPQRKATSESPTGDANALKERLRSHLQSKKDKIERMSSHGMDLHNMRDQLMAPSLSFDWNEPESDEDENSKGILQVEMPVTAANDRRALLREQLQRSVSFKQAEELSKVRSLPSSGSIGKATEVRNAATPSKKRKVAMALSEATTEPEKGEGSAEIPPEPPGDSEATATETVLHGLDACPVGPVPGSASEAGEEADAGTQAEGTRHQVTVEAPWAAPPAAAVPESGGPPVAPAEVAPEAPVIPCDSVTGDMVRPADLEISPTLRFVAEEPAGALEISPTLPFDIDATALQEACGLDDGPAHVAAAAEEAAQAPAQVSKDDPAQEASSDEASEEDEEIKGNARAMRERAWLRHKRNMQAMQSQEDELDDVPVGRAPKRRAKAKSILMGTV